MLSSPHRHRPGGNHAIDAEAATKRHFLHSYNVVHMPQGCGCVMGVAHMRAHARDLHSRDCLQDMARRMGKRSQLAGRGTYHTAFSSYCSASSADVRISKGEIDIVEGVNDQGSDLVSLHTSPGKNFRS